MSSQSIPELGLYSAACVASFEKITIGHEMLARIADVSLNIGEFIPIGEVTLDSDFVVSAGLKGLHGDSVKRVAAELHFGDQLLDHRPERARNLPRFTFPVVSITGKPKGILTEDFTRNGEHNLHEHRTYFDHRHLAADLGHGRAIAEDDDEIELSKLYDDVYEALSPSPINTENFGRMLGEVNGNFVLFDFDAVYAGDVPDRYKDVADSLTIRV